MLDGADVVCSEIIRKQINTVWVECITCWCTRPVGFKRLTFCGPNYSCDLQMPGPNKSSRKFLIFRLQKQPLDNRISRNTQ